MKLLSIESDAKTSKNTQFGYLTGIMYLSPFKESGVNLCPMAEVAKCHEPCLYFAGRGVQKNVQQARLERTKLFLNDQNTFMVLLANEIHSLIKKAERLGLKPAVRLNGTSDIRFENIKFTSNNKVQTIFEAFPDIQFLDYTKIPNRTNIPANYDLTFSYSGVDGFEKYNQRAIKKGIRIAVVFDKPENIPNTFKGLKVHNGDEHDLTFTRPQGTVLGLYAKGRARKDNSGFVIKGGQ